MRKVTKYSGKSIAKSHFQGYYGRGFGKFNILRFWSCVFSPPLCCGVSPNRRAAKTARERRTLYTEKELEELNRADEEIERRFREGEALTEEDRALDERLDLQALSDRSPNRSPAEIAKERKQARERYARNKEAAIMRGRQYQATHRESVAKNKARYYQEHKAELTESNKAYRAANKEKIARRRAEYYAEHRDAMLLKERERRHRAALARSGKEVLK